MADLLRRFFGRGAPRLPKFKPCVMYSDEPYPASFIGPVGPIHHHPTK